MTLLSFSGRGRLPLVRQTEAAECGLACLAMVALTTRSNSTLSDGTLTPFATAVRHFRCTK